MQVHWAVQVFMVTVGIFASSGFWAFLQYKDSGKKAETKLIMGLAYSEIVSLGLAYIDRGWISKDEFEEFQKYLWEPYRDLGGNGVGTRIMQEVALLPIKYHKTTSQTAVQAVERVVIADVE